MFLLRRLLYFPAILMSTAALKQRRGAFDIGSGTVKLQISDVENGRILSTIFGEERPCAFGADFLKSQDGTLSTSIQEKGKRLMRELKQIGDDNGCTDYSAIATAVFRNAHNGQDFVTEAARVLGIDKVLIVSQEVEAELGYATAQAMSNCKTCVAWDSGGGSFQISKKVIRSSVSYEEEDDDAASNIDSMKTDSSLCSSTSTSSGTSTMDATATAKSTSSLEMYMGAFGSGYANKTLVEVVQGRKCGDLATIPLNPIDLRDAEKLADVLERTLQEADVLRGSGVPTWLVGSEQVVAIGGPNSVFQLVCNVLTALNRRRKRRSSSLISDLSHVSGSSSGSSDSCHSGVTDVDTLPGIDDDDASYTVDSFTVADVRTALLECCGKTDKFLQEHFQPPQYSDPTTIIVPKLALVLAVMNHTKMKRVKAVPCIGSCAGMLITESLWHSSSVDVK